MITIGLILKTLFNHNIDYWVLIKYLSLFLFLFGVSAFFFLLFDKFSNKPKKPFLKVPQKWILWIFGNGLLYVIILGMVLGLEKSGEYFNYKLRDFYLSNNTIETTGVIIGMKRLEIERTGREDFYLIKFKNNEKTIQKGLMIKYSEKDDNYENKMFELKQNTLTLNRMKGSQLRIVYSEKFPSFLKII